MPLPLFTDAPRGLVFSESIIYNGVESEKHALFQNPVSELELTLIQSLLKGPRNRRATASGPLSLQESVGAQNSFQQLPLSSEIYILRLRVITGSAKAFALI